VLTLSVSDVFASNKLSFMIRQGSVDASGFWRSDTRRVGINFRYHFGWKKKEERTDIFNSEGMVQ